MQQYINLSQAHLAQFWLSVIDWILLDYIIRAHTWAKDIIVDGRKYYWINMGKIISDLPTLGISNENSMRKHISKLVNLDFLDRITQGNKSYFAPTDKVEEYCVGWPPSPKGGQVSPNRMVSIAERRDNSNINNNIKYISISVAQVKEKKGELIKELEWLLSSLRGQTDLKDVGADDIIVLWNSYSSKFKLPKVNLDNPKSLTIRKIKEAWGKLKSEFTKEEFNVGLQNYFKEIEQRKPDGNYYTHRFSLFSFLTQVNWIRKFMLINI